MTKEKLIEIIKDGRYFNNTTDWDNCDKLATAILAQMQPQIDLNAVEEMVKTASIGHLPELWDDSQLMEIENSLRNKIGYTLNDLK
jgi:hypothetical protein